MSEFVKRIVRPISLPVAAIGFIALMVFAASRILLAVPEVWSTSIALALSATVLFFASVLAAVKAVKSSQRMLAVLVGVGVLAAGGVGLSQGMRVIEKHGGGIEIVAKGIKFDVATLTFPAEEKVELAFANEDTGIPHNVGIYQDDTFSKELFAGEVFAGPATKTYEIEPLEEGTYAFRCDVHPDMKGSVVVDGAAEGGSSPSGAPEH